MGISLNPYTLSQNYSLSSIEEKITFYSDQLDKATVKSYNKDSSQGTQRVESADIERIGEILQVWLSAKQHLAGTAGPNIVSAGFREIPSRGRY